MTAEETRESILEPRPFGATGLAVPRLCVGTAPLGDMRGTFAHIPDEAQAIATARAALTGPIRFIDTAASYGDGTSERRLGEAIRSLGGIPDGVIIATKVDPIDGRRELTGDECRRSIARSQRLLGMDHLPLVYLHDPEYQSYDQLVGRGGAIDVLLDYQRQGIIGAVGVAGGELTTMRRMVELDVFSALITHNRYNVLNRSAATLIAEAARRGMGVCNAAPFGGGMLARGPSRDTRVMYRDASPRDLERARAFEQLARRFQVPLAAVALQFSIRDPRVSSTIVGMGTPERITQTVELASQPIPAELWEELAAMPFDESDPA